MSQNMCIKMADCTHVPTFIPSSSTTHRTGKGFPKKAKTYEDGANRSLEARRQINRQVVKDLASKTESYSGCREAEIKPSDPRKAPRLGAVVPVQGQGGAGTGCAVRTGEVHTSGSCVPRPAVRPLPSWAAPSLPAE